MPTLRSLGKFLGSFIFTTSLSLLIIVISLAEITSYENMKPVFVGLAEKKILEGDAAKLAELHSQLAKSCEGKESIKIPTGSENIEVKCVDVVSSTPENIGNVIATAMFDKVYYKKYNCNFIECIQLGGENLMVVASSTGNKFFQDSILYLSITTVLGVAIVFALNETYALRLKTVGKDCIGVGVMVFLILLTNFVVPSFVPAEFLPKISGFLNFVENSIMIRFAVVLVVGIVLFLIGFLIGREKD